VKNLRPGGAISEDLNNYNKDMRGMSVRAAAAGIVAADFSDYSTNIRLVDYFNNRLLSINRCSSKVPEMNNFRLCLQVGNPTYNPTHSTSGNPVPSPHRH